MGEWRYSFTVLDLGTRCKCNFTHLRFIPGEIIPLYSCDRKLGEPRTGPYVV
jgi:hypothetical protein